MEKNEAQKIRLILNVITPDNYDKKFKELRTFLFQDLRTREECEDDGEQYDESAELDDEKVRMDILETIVQNIFRKAQVEKEYCIFYGDLCEKMIKLELSLRNKKHSLQNMKISAFRRTLFEVCKQCFEKFFNEDEKKKSVENTEKAFIFRQKLFGNLDFVGELYRRKILPETVLVSVFSSLLGINDANSQIDDLSVEGAIQLMNKVGENYETRAGGKADKKEQFDTIIKKFQDYENLENESLITNRVKILIKNMFSNKESGW